MTTQRDTYITTPEQLAELAATDRLRPVTVKYRGTTEGRFSCPAQGAADMIAMLEATGRYPREIWLTI